MPKHRLPRGCHGHADREAMRSAVRQPSRLRRIQLLTYEAGRQRWLLSSSLPGWEARRTATQWCVLCVLSQWQLDPACPRAAFTTATFAANATFPAAAITFPATATDPRTSTTGMQRGQQYRLSRIDHERRTWPDHRQRFSVLRAVPKDAALRLLEFRLRTSARLGPWLPALHERRREGSGDSSG